MKIGLLLSGNGVYDGAEIQESVLAMLAIQEENAEYICISVDAPQHHVINHMTGEEMDESRNMMVEASRIARGEITEINDVYFTQLDGIVIPGGFGSAKNFTTWAFDGPNGTILPAVKTFLLKARELQIPIAALCVSPIVLAKAFEGSKYTLNMTIGTSQEKSPYDIHSFSSGMEQTGASTVEKSIKEILIDQENKIITAPCYMMDATILEIRNNIQQAVKALIGLSKQRSK